MSSSKESAITTNFILDSVSESLDQILSRGGRVVFVGPVPVMYRDPNAMASYHDWWGAPRALSQATIGTSDKFRQDLSHAAPLGLVSFIDLYQVLCNHELCPFSRRETSFLLLRFLQTII